MVSRGATGLARRVLVGERDDTQRVIGEELSGHTTESEEHERPEERVLGAPDDRLGAGFAHPLYDDTRQTGSEPLVIASNASRGHRRPVRSSATPPTSDL